MYALKHVSYYRKAKTLSGWNGTLAPVFFIGGRSPTRIDATAAKTTASLYAVSSGSIRSDPMKCNFLQSRLEQDFLLAECHFRHPIKARDMTNWLSSRCSTVIISSIIIGVGDGGRRARGGGNREKYFSGNYYVKFGHFSGKNRVKFGNFVNFSVKYHTNSGILIIFRQESCKIWALW